MAKSTFNGNYQNTYNGSIIHRMLGSDKPKTKLFHEQYKEACATNRIIRTPSKKDYDVYNTFRATKSISRTARDRGISNGHVLSAIARVTAELELTKE